MPITVTTTDGRTLQFPDGTSRDEMTAAMMKLPPLPSAPPPQGEPIPESLGSPWMVPQSTIAGDPRPTDETPEPFMRAHKLEDQIDNLGPRKYAAGVAANILPSVGNTIANVGSALYNLTPETTGQAIENFIPGIIEHYKTRFGSPEQAYRTLHDDPIGGILDISPVIGGTVGTARVAGPPLMRAAARAPAAVGRAATTAARHVGRNVDSYGALGSVSVGGDPFTGWIFGKAAEKAGDWWRNRQTAAGATEPVAPTAAATAEAQATVDQWLRDIIAKRDPAAWEGSPYAPPAAGPRPPTAPPPQPPAPPSAPQPTPGPPPPTTPPAPAGALADEILKRERATVDPRFYAPQQFLDEELVSINAMKQKNMGPPELRGESIQGLRRLIQKAKEAGDKERELLLRRLVSQRENMTENAIRRAQRGQ